MIIYMYLTIIVVFSILTGIITTIIEKKGLQVNMQKQSVQHANTSIQVEHVTKASEIPQIPIVKPATNLSHTVEVLNLANDFSSVSSDFNEAKILSIIDEEIL